MEQNGVPDGITKCVYFYDFMVYCTVFAW